ncbi:DMT family transporter [Nitrincola sp.]|uniref:DMT family transporter n=1 Tax=Nitrincola sp. TaxID=1926584 RepID=UPI003A90413C
MAQRPMLQWVLLVALAIIWGSSFALTSLIVRELSPASTVFLRNLLACLLLFPAALILRRPLARGTRLWLFMLAMALIGNALPFTLISWGQQRIDSGLAGILMAVMPLATAILAHFFLPDEPLSRHKLIGFFIGFCGILVLLGPSSIDSVSLSGEALLAQLAVLLAAVCYGLNTIIARRKPASDPWSTSASVLLMAACMIWPLATFTQGFSNLDHLTGLPGLNNIGDFSQQTLLAIALLGFICTGIATVIYLKLVTLAGPSFVSLINYLIPVWAVLVGVSFMNETPRWNHLVALLMILGGIAVSQRRQLKTALKIDG